MKIVAPIFVTTHEIYPLKTVGIIQSYDDDTDYDDELPLDYDEDDTNQSIHTVKVLWDNGQEVTVYLSSIIRHEDIESYVQQINNLRAIKLALVENFSAYADDNMGTVDEWFNHEMTTDRKVALMNACVPLKNIHLYDKLSVDELKSLKHHVRAMEGTGK